MSEAQSGCAILKEVEKETFERFVQFAYTGDYAVPGSKEWKKVAEPQEEGIAAPRLNGASSSSFAGLGSAFEEAKPIEDDDSLWRLGFTSNRKGKKDKKKTKIDEVDFGPWGTASSEPVPMPPSETPCLSVDDFYSLQYPLLASRNIHSLKCEPVGGFEPNRSYSNVLLSHASLYVLGDFWLIEALKALAMHKLHKALCAFVLDGKNVADIVDLARYAYEEEGKGSEEGTGGLRGLVCQYVALHAVVLSCHAVFTEFVAEGGQFATDFVRFVVRRIQ